jgi:hypothetical protein
VDSSFFVLATSRNSLSKNGDFSPFYPQSMATFAHLFPKKTLCTLLLCRFFFKESSWCKIWPLTNKTLGWMSAGFQNFLKFFSVLWFQNFGDFGKKTLSILVIFTLKERKFQKNSKKYLWPNIR